MGMYTDLHVKVRLKPEYIPLIRKVMENNYENSPWENSGYVDIEKFSKIDRSSFIPFGVCHDLSYERKLEEITGIWQFSCSLKNYSSTIEYFLDLVLSNIIEEAYDITYDYEEWTTARRYAFIDGSIVSIKDESTSHETLAYAWLDVDKEVTEPERVFLAPEKVSKPYGYRTVFLAGSIEMGNAVDWQTELTNKILADPYLDQLIMVNPRRKDWDSSWTQEISNPQFFEQVSWELENIEKAHYVVVYFDENTKSPITLMELGIASQRKPQNVVVVCPEKFYRKGNVDIVCERYGITQVDDLDGLVEFLKDNNVV